MKIYAVGGVIRDRLLGLPTKDIDYVVVGSSPQEMIALGYTPVGSDFPVFLHPQTKAEYALARTERKVAKGYKGFDFYADPSVTLEQDLLRRDLTINAMAQAVDEHGQLVGDIIDPYGGQDDLRQKVFRHVSEAFEEDPLRLLRLARFAARFDGFHVHPETLKLLRKIVANQELDALVVERVWQELAKLLMGQTPSNGLKILRDCGVLKYFFGLDEQASNINDALNLIDASASAQHVLAQRVAAIFIGMPHHASSWALRWKVPNECKEYATHIGHVLDLTMLIQSPPIVANNILGLIDRVDFWRKPDRFHQLIAVVALTQVPTNKLDKLTLELKALDLSTALQGGLSGAQIKEQIDRIRLEKIQQFFAS